MANQLTSITKYALLVKRPGSTIRLMCRDGRLGAVKIGNQWLVNLDSPKTKDANFLQRGRPLGSKGKQIKQVRKPKPE